MNICATKAPRHTSVSVSQKTVLLELPPTTFLTAIAAFEGRETEQ